MNRTFLDSPEDVKWLRETHLSHVTSLPAFKSFVLEGNEDAPDRVLLYTAKSPRYDDVATVFQADEDGDLHRVVSRYSEKFGYGENPRARDMGEHVHSWLSAEAFLRGKQERKLGNNTVVRRVDDGPDIAVYLHRTPIITYSPDGGLTLRNGGWQTATTKQRIAQLLPFGFHIHQEKHEWYVTTPRGVYDFYDGMQLQSDGLLVGYKKFDGADATFVQSAKHLRNPTDEQGREYEVLEPNWHNMGRWALAGINSYVGTKGELRKRLSKEDRKSVIALLATACAASFYVYDIGTDVLSLLGNPIEFRRGHDNPEEAVLREAEAFLSGKPTWDNLCSAIAWAAGDEQWGNASNALSEALE